MIVTRLMWLIHAAKKKAMAKMIPRPTPRPNLEGVIDILYDGFLFLIEEVYKYHFERERDESGFTLTHLRTGRRFRVQVTELDNTKDT